MGKTFIPEGYKSKLDIIETQKAIKALKDNFERGLAKKLNLFRVSAPLYVKVGSGLNDDLTGVERSVKFDYCDGEAEIVHSLAKWKRNALGLYNFEIGTGLYTDMNAIRRDEVMDNIHSMYVDQWDWEICIDRSDRNVTKLENVVKSIYEVFLDTEDLVNTIYGFEKKLPEKIKFIDSQELYDLYPNLSAKDREHEICKKYGAVFISRIGAILNSGCAHDLRSPDYDDWELNGDILFYNKVLDQALELSSMGIRVDSESLKKQLKASDKEDRMKFSYHQKVLNNELPLTIGGGIGQSRICMFFLEKAHIGEVQASLWDEETTNACEKANVTLL